MAISIQPLFVEIMPELPRIAIAVALLSLVVVLSLTPARPGRQRNIIERIAWNTPSYVQKFLHVVFYALLTATWVWAFNFLTPMTIRATSILAFIVIIGILIEWRQKSIPGRIGSISDIALNILGALLGIGYSAILLPAWG